MDTARKCNYLPIEVGVSGIVGLEKNGWTINPSF